MTENNVDGESVAGEYSALKTEHWTHVTEAEAMTSIQTELGSSSALLSDVFLKPRSPDIRMPVPTSVNLPYLIN